MTGESWTLASDSGELHVITGVGGPAAKMGHRLTIAMTSWRASVQWQGDQPVAAELDVDVDSLQVLEGQGGVTPLTGPEKSVVRTNALKSMDAKKYPTIHFETDNITKGATGYRLAGTVVIHGKSRPQVVDLTTEDQSGIWAMSAEVPVNQTDFGIRPFSLLMGTMKVADQVTIRFSAQHSG